MRSHCEISIPEGQIESQRENSFSAVEKRFLGDKKAKKIVSPW